MHILLKLLVLVLISSDVGITTQHMHACLHTHGTASSRPSLLHSGRASTVVWGSGFFMNYQRDRENNIFRHLQLRGGSSRSQAAARNKAKYLAQKMGYRVDAVRRAGEQKLRDKHDAMTSSGPSKKQSEEQRMERELDELENAPFNPPQDAVSIAAAEKRAQLLSSKYTPGEMVEIEDSEEWRRATEGEPGATTHTLDVWDDDSEFVHKYNERYWALAEGRDVSPVPEQTCDMWDMTRPDGTCWGDEKVPQLKWGQDPVEIAGILGDRHDQRSQEQWIGEEQLFYIEQMKREAVENATIDVDARARQIYVDLVNSCAHPEGGGGGGGDVPQPSTAWNLCYQVALRENAKAQDEALEMLRQKRVRYDPQTDDKYFFCDVYACPNEFVYKCACASM